MAGKISRNVSLIFTLTKIANIIIKNNANETIESKRGTYNPMINPMLANSCK